MKYTIVCLIVFLTILNLVCNSPLETDTENEKPREMFFFPSMGYDHPINRTKRDLISSITSGGLGALLGGAKPADGAAAATSGAAPAEGEAPAEGGGSSLSSLIPGFQEYGPAFMSLINNFLGFMKCCKPVIIPSVVAKLLMKCSDDLTNRFFQDSGFLNRSELGNTRHLCIIHYNLTALISFSSLHFVVDKKTTIFLKSPSLSGFFEAEFLGVDGLPIPAKMNATLKMVMPVQFNLLTPAFQECVKSYESELALVKGSQCLQKMSDFFWGEMPKQVGKFFSVIKSMVDIL
ncbi:hypothetical protein B566_EDAN004926 [Ephemera danica]|nr:hypothetical protein B566_EDAN004926 [Ephemera danica]